METIHRQFHTTDAEGRFLCNQINDGVLHLADEYTIGCPVCKTVVTLSEEQFPTE